MPAHPVGEPLRGSLLRPTTKCDQVALTRGAQLFSTRATMTLTRSVSEGERFTGLFDESRQPSVRPRSRFGLVCAFPNVSSSPARRIYSRPEADPPISLDCDRSSMLNRSPRIGLWMLLLAACLPGCSSGRSDSTARKTADNSVSDTEPTTPI